ncbi:MAG: glycosyltransferase family 2 protein [Candidatus Kryptoniota bacterium]
MLETLTFNDLCVVVVNYRTPDLLQRAVSSFRNFYPDIDLVIIDNGSDDASVHVANKLQSDSQGKLKSLFLKRNFYHGPAMDIAIRTIEKEIFFFLDTDTETIRGGFLEKMLFILQDDYVYAVGKKDRVNKRGFSSEHGIAIVISAYMMLKKSKYVQLPPFRHHGMPTLENFAAASSKGFGVVDFPIDQYIRHFGRGTASRFGYRLGVKGKLDYLLNKIGL